MDRVIKPVDSITQLNNGWKPYSNMSHTATEVCAPVVMAELAALMGSYVLAFVKDENQRFQLVALQGIFSGENLLVNGEGGWLLEYVPSVYRSYPFSIQEVQVEGQPRRILCFDHSNELFRENPDSERGEERFFDADGQLQPRLQATLKFLTARLNSQLQTQRAVDELARQELLNPWKQPIQNPDSTRTLLGGLYVVDQPKLNGLNSESLLALSRVNALALAYAQLLSAPRLSILGKLYGLKNQVAAEKTKTLDSHELAGEPDEDAFNFDFGWLESKN